MLNFGEFEANENPYYSKGFVRLYLASKGGEPGGGKWIIKVIDCKPKAAISGRKGRTPKEMPTGPVTQEPKGTPDNQYAQTEVLARIAIQQKVADAGCPNAAKILAWGEIPENHQVWFAVPHFSRGNLKHRLFQNIRVTNSDLRQLFCSLLNGISAYQSEAGRPHGNLLNLNNIMLGGQPGWPLFRSPIHLMDPAPGNKEQARELELSDLKALGALLYQLVCQTESQAIPWPVPLTDHWRRLGSEASGWLELCNQLLDPKLSSSELSLESLQTRFPYQTPPRLVIPWKTILTAGVPILGLAIFLVMASNHQPNKAGSPTNSLPQPSPNPGHLPPDSPAQEAVKPPAPPQPRILEIQPIKEVVLKEDGDPLLIDLGIVASNAPSNQILCNVFSEDPVRVSSSLRTNENGKYQISLTPGHGSETNVTIRVEIADLDGFSKETKFAVQFLPNPKPPIIQPVPPVVLDEGSPPKIIPLAVSDPDGTADQIRLSVNSANMAVVLARVERSAQGAWQLVLNPLRGAATDVPVTVTATDSQNLSYDLHIQVQFRPRPKPPILVMGTNQAVLEEGTTATIPFTITDPDTPLNLLKVQAVSDQAEVIKPAATLHDSGRGELALKTGAALRTVNARVTISVTDDKGLSDAKVIVAQFIPTPKPPKIKVSQPVKFSRKSTELQYRIPIEDVDTPPSRLKVEVTSSNPRKLEAKPAFIGGGWVIDLRARSGREPQSVSIVVRDPEGGEARAELPILFENK